MFEKLLFVKPKLKYSKSNDEDVAEDKTRYYHGLINAAEAKKQIMAADQTGGHKLGRFLFREAAIAAALEDEPDSHVLSVLTSKDVVTHYRIERPEPFASYTSNTQSLGKCNTLVEVVAFLSQSRSTNASLPALTDGVLGLRVISSDDVTAVDKQWMKIDEKWKKLKDADRATVDQIKHKSKRAVNFEIYVKQKKKRVVTATTATSKRLTADATTVEVEDVTGINNGDLMVIGDGDTEEVAVVVDVTLLAGNNARKVQHPAGIVTLQKGLAHSHPASVLTFESKFPARPFSKGDRVMFYPPQKMAAPSNANGTASNPLHKHVGQNKEEFANMEFVNMLSKLAFTVESVVEVEKVDGSEDEYIDVVTVRAEDALQDMSRKHIKHIRKTFFSTNPGVTLAPLHWRLQKREGNDQRSTNDLLTDYLLAKAHPSQAFFDREWEVAFGKMHVYADGIGGMKGFPRSNWWTVTHEKVGTGKDATDRPLMRWKTPGCTPFLYKNSLLQDFFELGAYRCFPDVVMCELLFRELINIDAVNCTYTIDFILTTRWYDRNFDTEKYRGKNNIEVYAKSIPHLTINDVDYR